MANQDPQPEIYTTRYNFNADTGAGGATIAAKHFSSSFNLHKSSQQ